MLSSGNGRLRCAESFKRYGRLKRHPSHSIRLGLKLGIPLSKFS